MPGGKRTNDINKLLADVSDLEADGKLRQAIKELERAVKADVADGNIYNRLGDLHIKTNDTRDAIEAFKKGVDSFRKDTYYRNALALCKKILRYDPGNIDIYGDIGQLLIDLDEKSDALIYYFAYVDKQLEQGLDKEALRTIDKIRNIGILDSKVIKKINEAYKVMGRDDLLKKFAKEIMKEEVSDDFILEEIVEEPVKKVESRPSKEEIFRHKEDLLTDTGTIDIGTSSVVKKKDDDVRLTQAVMDIESTLSQLRKAMRLDEVIVALEKSLSSLSLEQKTAIALLQKAVNKNLDTLQHSIEKMYSVSEKNTKEITPLLSNLASGVATLNNHQGSFVQKLNENFTEMKNSYTKNTERLGKEVTGILHEYKKTTDDMCHKLDDTKECNLSMLQYSEEMKIAVLKMNDVLTKYIIAQEIKDRKQSKLTFAVMGMLGVIIVLFVLSLIIK